MIIKGEKCEIQIFNHSVKFTVEEAIKELDILREKLDKNNRKIRFSAAKL